jgi:hypothetical protein
VPSGGGGGASMRWTASGEVSRASGPMVYS